MIKDRIVKLQIGSKKIILGENQAKKYLMQHQSASVSKIIGIQLYAQDLMNTINTDQYHIQFGEWRVKGMIKHIQRFLNAELVDPTPKEINGESIDSILQVSLWLDKTIQRINKYLKNEIKHLEQTEDKLATKWNKRHKYLGATGGLIALNSIFDISKEYRRI